MHVRRYRGPKLAIPADAQAALLAAWKAMEDRIAELEAIVCDFQAMIDRGRPSRSPRSWCGCRIGCSACGIGSRPRHWISGGTDSAREPIRGADADGGGHLPPARAELAEQPDILLRGSSVWPGDPLPLASVTTKSQGCLIPANPLRKRLQHRITSEFRGRRKCRTFRESCRR